MKITVEYNIEVGRVFNISPSEGMQGIERGLIKVIAMEEYEDAIATDPYWEDLAGEDPSLFHTSWVRYSYVHPTQDTNDSYTLPIDMFAEHITRY